MQYTKQINGYDVDFTIRQDIIGWRVIIDGIGKGIASRPEKANSYENNVNLLEEQAREYLCKLK